jgi:type 1 fimbria pilin
MILIRFLLCIGLSLVGANTMAACNFRSGSQGLTLKQPLQAGSLTIGRDVPQGAEIYRQSFSSSTPLLVTCTGGTSTAQRQAVFSSVPLSLSDWNNSPYAQKVYTTTVPGIGVVIEYYNAAVPHSSPTAVCSNASSQACDVDITQAVNFDLVFIKIGDVSSGTIQGSSLPAVAINWVTDNSLRLGTLDYSGSINIVSQTCTTSDVIVPMGSHKLSEFSGKNTFTAWQDFSITLSNCPAFHGYYQSAGPTWSNNGTVVGVDLRKSNVLKVRLDSTITPVDPTRGILQLNAGSSGGAASARGVGLQVADNLGNPLRLATLYASGVILTNQAGGSYNIPLRARYIQTEDSITAGPANATSTFTIDYY